MSGTENKLWSPANAYIGLAMLAEVTAGNSRQQILDLFGADSIETLRAQVSAIWESAYANNGKELCTLANSLWIDSRLSYKQTVVDDLAHYHYASVYQGALDSEKTAQALKTWINKNTGNFLQESVKNLDLGPQPLDDGTRPYLALILASTVYLKSQWQDDFNKSLNSAGKFKAPNSNITCTFMN